MRRAIKQLLREREKALSLTAKDMQNIKEDLSIFLRAAFYEKVPSGRYSGMPGIAALPLLFRDVAFGITGMSKAQQATVIRLIDQFVGRGELAAEQKDQAEANAPKVVYVGAGEKKAPLTATAVEVPTLGEGK